LKRNKNNKIQGYVTEVKSFPAKFGGFCHRVYLKKKSYNIFDDSDLCLLKSGDLVEFEFYKTGKTNWQYNKIDENTLRIKNPKETASITEGYVYILKNSSMPGLYKIGCTTRTPQERANELYYQASGVPTKFEVEWFLAIAGDPYVVEQKVHAILNSKRTGKEFFQVKLDEAIKIISETCLELYPNQNHLDQVDDILSSRKTDIEKKREALVTEHENKAKETERLKKQQEYEQSDEYKWLTKGQIELNCGRKLINKKIGGGFLEKIFKDPPPNWLEARILVHEKDRLLVSSLVISKSQGWAYSEFRPENNHDISITEAVRIFYQKWSEGVIDNSELTILIGNMCVENIADFPMPEKYWQHKQIQNLNEIKMLGYLDRVSTHNLFINALNDIEEKEKDMFLKIFTG
jgi:hypothetical protein